MEQALKALLEKHGFIKLAILFGSLANDNAHPDSDIDLAVLGEEPLSEARKMMLTAAIGEAFGRPVDLVDLRTTGEPLLGQVLQGKRILGSSTDYAQLLTRHLLDTADFLPLRQRILKERRDAWTR